jgi:hypothetical protein
MMLHDDFQRATARLLKLIDITLNHPGSEKTDLLTIAARLKKATGPDAEFTKAVHRCANAVLLWGYYGTEADEQALHQHTCALLRAFNPKGK